VRSRRWVPSLVDLGLGEFSLSLSDELAVVGREDGQSIVDVLVVLDLHGTFGFGTSPMDEDVSGLVRNSFKFQTKSDEGEGDLVLSQRVRKR